MTTFRIFNEVASLLPSRQVVVTAKELDNGMPNLNVAAHVRTTVDKTVASFHANGYPNAQSHPRVALYRNTLKSVANVSFKKYPQSHESLIKRVLKEKKPDRSISPAVDFYNGTSIEHGVTAGVFDLGELRAASAPLEVRFANIKQDRFLPLDTATDAQLGRVDKYEILYAQYNTVLARHMAWRQSKQTLVTDESTELCS